MLLLLEAYGLFLLVTVFVICFFAIITFIRYKYKTITKKRIEVYKIERYLNALRGGSRCERAAQIYENIVIACRKHRISLSRFGYDNEFQLRLDIIVWLETHIKSASFIKDELIRQKVSTEMTKLCEGTS